MDYQWSVFHYTENQRTQVYSRQDKSICYSLGNCHHLTVIVSQLITGYELYLRIYLEE